MPAEAAVCTLSLAQAWPPTHLCRKPQVLELEQPVEDRAGFVYDKAAITRALQANGGAIVCPVAGASHTVRMADLRPCRRIERAKKAARLQNLRNMVQQQAAPAAAAADAGAGASSSSRPRRGA